mgnify:FL=1
MLKNRQKCQEASHSYLDQRMSHWVRSSLLTACALAFGACAPLDLLNGDNQRINDLRVGSSHVVGPNRRDGDLHMANGYSYLKTAQIEPSGFFFARAAFERAAVIKVDDPIPVYLTGYSFFELGQYADASRYFVSAALLDRTADGWWLASLSELRAGHEIAAQSLYDQGKRANPGRSIKLKTFMESLYGLASQSNDVVVRNTLFPITAFECTDVSGEVENVDRLCASDLEIEFFIIERTISAGSKVGQDILSDLSLDIEGSRRVSQTSSSSNPVPSTSFSQSISLDIPSLNYDLSLASNGEMSDTVTASPQIRVYLNKPSTMTSGEKITLVSSGSSGSSGTDLSRSIVTQSGITISASLSRFNETSAQIVASLEISDTSSLEIKDGFARLSNNTSKLDTAREVEYNTAFVLGSLRYREELLKGRGQTGLRNVPVLGALFGQTESSSIKKELAVLGVLRQPARIVKNEEAQFLSQIGERGVASANRARRQPVVHTMPPMRDFMADIGLLD